MLFTIWLGTGMGLALIAGWLAMRYLLQKSFHHEPIAQNLRPVDFQLSSRELFITTQNRKKIQVFFIGEKNTGPLVLAMHGYENTVEKFFPVCKFLVEKNYRIVLVNTRNHGASDSDGYSTLIQFGEDLDAAYKYVRSYFGSDIPIVLVGHSLGGATVLYRSVHIPDIAGVISIASFADLQMVLAESFLRKQFPQSLLPVVFRYIEWSVGDRFDNLSPRSNMSKIKCPVLLLHGENDRIVPIQALHQLEDAAGSRLVKSKIIRGADHSSLLDQQITFDTIDDFISSLT